MSIETDHTIHLPMGPIRSYPPMWSSGRVFWRYRHTLPAGVTPCCGRVNRGLAMLGNTLYMGTLDARLIALDTVTGRKRWDVQVADYASGYVLTLAPLAVRGKIVVGVAGGELGIRGFIAAFDAGTGKETWRFKTIPEPSEPRSRFSKERRRPFSSRICRENVSSFNRTPRTV